MGENTKDGAGGKSGYFFLVAVMAYGYTVLRSILNTEFSGVPWQQLYDLSAPLPAGSRLLVPLLSRPLVQLGLSVRQAYSVWEFGAAVFLILALYGVFKLHLGDKWAKAFSLGFVFILPFAFLLGLVWPIYYPYDTLAMGMIVFCLWLMLKERWGMLLLFTVISTLNRETSIYVPLLFGVIYFDRLPPWKWARLLAALLSAYVLTRLALVYVTRHNPQPYGPVGFLLKYPGRVIKYHWRVDNNIGWLFNFNNLFIFIATMAFIPLLYASLKRHVPAHLRLFPLVALTCFLPLLFVGNMYEPRQFGEFLVVLYIPLMLALYAYLTGETVPPPRKTLPPGENAALIAGAGLLEKYGYLLVITLAAIAALVMNLLGEHYFFPSLSD